MTKLQTKIIRLGFLAAVLVFLALYVRSIDFSKIDNVSVNLVPLFISGVLGVAFRYWGVVIWRTILSDLGSKTLPRFTLLSSVYSKAWMGRYIPGTVTWIAGKIYLAGSVGISKSRLAVASVLEAGVQIVAITAVSFLLLGFDARLAVVPIHLRLLLVAGALALLVCLHPTIFNRILGTGFRLLRRKEAYSELKTNSKAVFRSFLLYALGSFIAGTSSFLLAYAVEPSTSWHMFFYLVGAYNLAGVIGMATPFVPSGLGVRDGAQLLLLSVVFPTEIAFILTVAARLWSVVLDVLFYAIAQAHYRLTTNLAR